MFTIITFIIIHQKVDTNAYNLTKILTLNYAS